MSGLFQGKRIGLLVICVLLSLVLGGALFTSYPKRALRRIERQWLILTGGLIDVGGFHLRIECRGTGKTVVFDGGLGQSRATWGIVPDEVSKFARACTYDRAGVGESDQAGFTRTSADAVQELKTLLEKAGEEGPFVLVGHSFGGLNVRLFASKYPTDTAGLVLVDPSHEDQYEKIAGALPSDEATKFLEHEKGQNGERMDLLSSASLTRSTRDRPPVPTVLLSAETGETHWEILKELHSQLIATFSCGSLVRLPNTSHFVQHDRPEVVVESVRKVIQEPVENCGRTFGP